MISSALHHLANRKISTHILEQLSWEKSDLGTFYLCMENMSGFTFFFLNNRLSYFPGAVKQVVDSIGPMDVQALTSMDASLGESCASPKSGHMAHGLPGDGNMNQRALEFGATLKRSSYLRTERRRIPGWWLSVQQSDPRMNSKVADTCGQRNTKEGRAIQGSRGDHIILKDLLMEQ